jgi:hypothetical protein
MDGGAIASFAVEHFVGIGWGDGADEVFGLW